MKMRLVNIITGFCWMLAIACLCSCQRELSTTNDGSSKVFNLNVNFRAVVDGQPLVFDEPYHNALGEAYKVSTFKYYIHDISLINTDSNIVSVVDKDNHYLVDASVPASGIISAKPASHTYNHISFTIGVDSSRNFSGAQTGALDPSNGMFWTWNSGYIMAKLEGSSPLSTQPNNRIEFHIGGYKSPDNVAKKITLDFPSEQGIAFLPGSTGTINITANVNAWFSNPNDIHIAANAVCMTPGDLAKKIAVNYSKMFTVTGIQRN
jgi:hypothetical protein